MFRRTYAEVNIENLLHNWEEIRSVASDDRFICPMVKANAYGHGMVEVSKILEREGAKYLGVCLIEEALELRAAGIKNEILVFRGFDKRGAEKIVEYQLTPVVSSWEHIKALESMADDPIKVHLKFNTGMARLGFEVDEVEKLTDYFAKSRKLKLRAVLSHYAQSDDALVKGGVTQHQTKLFKELVSYFKGKNVYFHLLNSGGIQGLAEAKKRNEVNFISDTIWGMRPGLILYGYGTHPSFTAMNLKPVMTFKSVVNNVRKLQKGESVSYGGTWVAKRPSSVAVVPVGYADGVHRVLSNKSQVIIGGEKLPIVGSICMDFLMVDITDLCAKNNRSSWVEEEVTIFGYDESGEFISAEEQAKKATTITWETLTSISDRVPRHYKGLIKA